MKKSKKITIIIILAVLIVAGIIAAVGFSTKKDTKLSGKLTAIDNYGKLYTYDFEKKDIAEIKIDGYSELFDSHSKLYDFAGYDSTGSEFFCSARQDDEYYILKVRNNQVTASWKIPDKPYSAKRVGESIIIAFTDSVSVLNTESGEIENLLKNEVNLGEIAVYGNKFVIWGETTYCVGETANGEIILGDIMTHDASLKISCFTGEDEVLLYSTPDCRIYSLKLSGNYSISESSYDFKGAIPKAVNKNNILCLNESERKFFVYMTDKKEFTQADVDEKFVHTVEIDWND